jgi:hypothetical protein
MKTATRFFGSWKLLSWRTASVTAVVVYGLIGIFLVPVIAKKLIVDIALERTGRAVTIDEVRCNPFTLSLTIRDFSMPDRPGSTFVAFDELYANAQVSSLFRWAATLKELRVEKPYLGFRRFGDGGVNLLELMDDIKKRTPPSDEPEDESGLPRVLLQHILVTEAAMDVEDHAREEPLMWNYGPSRFEFHNISTIPEAKGDNDFVIGLLRGGTVGVTGEVVVEPLGLDGTVEVDRIFLEPAWEALQPFFKFDVVDGVAGGDFSYSISMAEDGLHAVIDEADFLVESIEVTAGSADETVLEVASVATSGVSIAWPEARVRGSSIVVEGAVASQWIRADGTPSWDALVPKETRQRTVEIYHEVEEAFPWDIALDRFEINASTARVEDRTFDEPQELVVSDANFELTDVATGPGRRWGLSASAMILGEAKGSAEGFVDTGPMRFETTVAMEGLDVGRLQPYIERMAPLVLRAGRLESKGTATVDPKGDGPALSFAGDLTIHEIDLRETAVGSRVLQWGRVESRGIEAELGPQSVEIASIDIHGAGIDVVVSEDGRVNLIELFKVMAEQSAEAGRGDETEVPPITVDAVTLHGCSSAYTDRTLTPPFTLALDPVDGTVKGISSTATAGAALDIEGAVRSGGLMALEGEMDLFDPKRLTDLSIDVRQAVLPPMAPMSVRYIGHPIDEGTVDIALRYEIVTSDLVGSNHFVADGLALGDKVEGEGMVDLPFKLGVSLLTDKEGRITLEFPIEGNLDDPSFGLGNAIGSAVTELTGELIKSPFRLLGKLGGGSGDEDLGFVEFEAGSAELELTALDRLRTLAAGADQRPELVLLIEGSWDAEADTAGLKEAAFEARIAEQEASRELFEAMYLEVGSQETLQNLQSQSMSVDESTGEQALDETAYYRDLRAALIEAQPVDAAGLQTLADDRAEAIRTFLVEGGGVDPARLRIIESVAAEKPSASGWVRCRLDVEAPQ